MCIFTVIFLYLSMTIYAKLRARVKNKVGPRKKHKYEHSGAVVRGTPDLRVAAEQHALI